MTQAAPSMADAVEGSEDEGGKIRGRSKRIVYHNVDPRLLWLALDDLEVSKRDTAVKANQKETDICSLMGLSKAADGWGI